MTDCARADVRRAERTHKTALPPPLQAVVVALARVDLSTLVHGDGSPRSVALELPWEATQGGGSPHIRQRVRLPPPPLSLGGAVPPPCIRRP
jgi:hypothetical protein